MFLKNLRVIIQVNLDPFPFLFMLLLLTLTLRQSGFHSGEEEEEAQYWSQEHVQNEEEDNLWIPPSERESRVIVFVK